MADEQLDANSPPDYWLRGLLNGAVMLAVATGFLYFIGTLYAGAYFNRFYIDPKSLGLPTQYYVMQGFYSAIYLVPLLVFLPSVRSDWKKVYSRHAVENYLIYIIVVNGGTFIFGLFFPFSQSRLSNYLLWTIALVVILYSASRRKLPLTYWDWIDRSQVLIMTVSAVVAFVMVLLYPLVSGNSEASRLITGHSGPETSLTLEAESPLVAVFEGKTLRMIYDSSEAVYLVQEDRSNPHHPVVIVVPKSQIVGMTLKR